MLKYEAKQREQNKREQEYFSERPKLQYEMLMNKERKWCTHCSRKMIAEFFGHSKQCLVPVRVKT